MGVAGAGVVAVAAAFSSPRRPGAARALAPSEPTHGKLSPLATPRRDPRSLPECDAAAEGGTGLLPPPLTARPAPPPVSAPGTGGGTGLGRPLPPPPPPVQQPQRRGAGSCMAPGLPRL